MMKSHMRAQDDAARAASLAPRAPYMRCAAALLIAPVATACLIEAAFFGCIGAAPGGEELSVVIRFGLITGFFVELLVFLPLYVLARRFLRLSLWMATLLGALSGWIAPVAYFLLMAVWRGEALNAWVINFSDTALSPWLALFGALGGLIFWLILRVAELTPIPVYRNRWRGLRRETTPSLSEGFIDCDASRSTKLRIRPRRTRTDQRAASIALPAPVNGLSGS